MILTSYTINNTGIVLTSSGADSRLAQGIKTQITSIVERISINLSPLGSPGGYIYIEIQSDSSGLPSGSAIEDGVSNPVYITSIDASEYTIFEFNAYSRPQILKGTQYHIVLRHGGYTQDVDNYVKLICDQTSPSYLSGAGSTYDGSVWTAITTDTDFNFYVYSGRRDYVYSRLNEVTALTKHFTDATSKAYTESTNPSIFAVLDFEESVSDTIDAWLAGAGVSTPLESDTGRSMVRLYANHCVAHNCEMTARSAGFRAKESGTRTASFYSMCDALRKDLMSKNGLIADAIKEQESDISASSSSGLTAGQIDVDERDDSRDDSSILQPGFQTGMWDNKQ